MDTALFDYELPERSIAQRPPARRDAARMLVLDRQGVRHGSVSAWPERMIPGDLVVVNDTRVRKSRLLGRRRGSDGRVEIFLLAPIESANASRQTWRALGRANRPLRVGQVVDVGELTVTVGEREGDGTLTVHLQSALAVETAIERFGRVPLPPYVKRDDDADDALRYQTVYARHPGSSAAPTAGLHLTEEMLSRLEARGIEVAAVTLDVGLGTFRPVTARDLNDHVMHPERYRVSPRLAEQIAAARQRGRQVVAVGTTVVRALESAAAARPGLVEPGCAHTRLLIQPGHAFRVVDSLLTNFHMPRSTLLALVSAFAGRDRVLAAYRAAVEAGYRFLSYGDAMWLPERLP